MSNEHNNAPAVMQGETDGVQREIAAALALFPIDISSHTFRVSGVNSDQPLDADDDTQFFSKKKVMALLEKLYGHLTAAATPAHAPAQEPIKDHVIREVVNQLRDCAVQFHATQQLRERIAGIVVPVLKQTPAQEVASAFTKALEIRMSQGWNLTGNAIPVLYTDTINDYQVRRDDVWLCTTDALKTKQEAGLTDEWISVSDRLPDGEPGAPAIEFYNEDLRNPTRQVIGIYRDGEWLSGGHQFSNVTYWKPLTPAPLAALRAKGASDA